MERERASCSSQQCPRKDPCVQGSSFLSRPPRAREPAENPHRHRNYRNHHARAPTSRRPASGCFSRCRTPVWKEREHLVPRSNALVKTRVCKDIQRVSQPKTHTGTVTTEIIMPARRPLVDLRPPHLLPPPLPPGRAAAEIKMKSGCFSRCRTPVWKEREHLVPRSNAPTPAP
jgi:hypothetical protein